MDWRAIIGLSFVVLLASAGCVGLSGTPSDDDGGVSPADARNRSLAAEESYIFEQLRAAPCVTSGTPGGYTGTRNATVLESSDAGYRVAVSYPYSFSTNDGVEADPVSEAVYSVNETTTTRVSGSEIVSC